MTLLDQQRAMCARYGALFVTADENAIVGVARNLGSGIEPLHGLRHLPGEGTCGWYLWAGELSNADDFFEPTHVRHLHGLCPRILPYLGFAPGWRFLIASDHEDVWFDAKLLAVSG